MSYKFFYSKKNKRKLSDFFGQGLLFDYIEGKLDSERKNAIEELIKESSEIKETYENMNKALSYCRDIQKINLQPDLIKKLNGSTGIFNFFLLLFNFSKWKPAYRWVFITLLMVFSIVIIEITFPWEKLYYKFLAYKKNKGSISFNIGNDDFSKDKTVALNDYILDNDENRLGNDENKFDNGEKVKVIEEIDDNNVIVQKGIHQDNLTKKLENKNDNRPRRINIEDDEYNDEIELEVNKQKKNAEKEIQNKDSSKKLPGLVHKIFMYHNNVNAITEDVVKIIKLSGGIKAGKKELGWRIEGGGYFHFKIEEENYSDVIKKLEKYGNLYIKKDKHIRVMPEGIIRCILWIEQNK